MHDIAGEYNYSYSCNGLDVDRVRWVKTRLVSLQPQQGLQLLDQFFLNGVWMMRCYVGRQSQITWGWSWGGLSRDPWPCCSWTGLAQLTELLVFWGKWLLQGLRSSSTGQHQGYKGGVFNFSNLLLVFASLVMFVLSVAGASHWMFTFFCELRPSLPVIRFPQ